MTDSIVALADLTNMTATELLAYTDQLRSAMEAVKSQAALEQERLQAEFKAKVQEVAEFVAAYGDRTETALWAGYKGRTTHVVIADVTYSVAVTLTDVKRAASLKVAKAESSAK